MTVALSNVKRVTVTLSPQTEAKLRRDFERADKEDDTRPVLLRINQLPLPCADLDKSNHLFCNCILCETCRAMMTPATWEFTDGTDWSHSYCDHHAKTAPANYWQNGRG